MVLWAAMRYLKYGSGLLTATFKCFLTRDFADRHAAREQGLVAYRAGRVETTATAAQPCEEVIERLSNIASMWGRGWV